MIPIILIFGMIALLMGKTYLAIGFFLGAIVAGFILVLAQEKKGRGR